MSQNAVGNLECGASDVGDVLVADAGQGNAAAAGAEAEELIYTNEGDDVPILEESREERPGEGHPTQTMRLVLTTIYCCCFFALGLILAALGPILLELALQVQTSFSSIAAVFTCRAVGYICGAAGGPLFDVLDGNMLLGLSLLVAGLATLLIPFVQHLWLLVSVVAFQGTAMGFLDTGGNVLLFRLHGKEVGPYMQALHFAFGLGALASPMFLSLFLNDTYIVDGVAVADPRSLRTPFLVFGAAFLPVAGCLCFVWVTGRSHQPTPTSSQVEGENGDATGGELQISSAVLEGRRGWLHTLHGYVGASATEQGVVLCTAAILFFYVGAEVGAGAYLAPYGRKALDLPASTAARLAFVFWLSISLGRFAAIFISLKVGPAKMLFMDILGSLIVSVVYLLLASSSSAVWLCTALYGFCMASIFPSSLALGESYVDITGKKATVIVLGASSGEMLIPWVLGYSMSLVSNAMLFVTFLLTAAAMLIQLGLIVFFGERHQQNRSCHVKHISLQPMDTVVP